MAAGALGVDVRHSATQLLYDLAAAALMLLLTLLALQLRPAVLLEAEAPPALVLVVRLLVRL